jgi:hypothetical protein
MVTLYDLCVEDTANGQRKPTELYIATVTVNVVVKSLRTDDTLETVAAPLAR